MTIGLMTCFPKTFLHDKISTAVTSASPYDDRSSQCGNPRQENSDFVLY